MHDPQRKELASCGYIQLDEWIVYGPSVTETYYTIRTLGHSIRITEREDAFKMFTEIALKQP